MFCIKGTNKSDGIRVNEEIRCREVRVISENGDLLGVMSPKEAMEIAMEHNLDLVEISPNAVPPVCKVMNYGKFRYEKTKKEKENKKKQKNVTIKELRIKPHIDEHDKQTKIVQITKFLEKEYKVKVSLKLSGREKLHIESSIKILDNFAEYFKDLAIVEKKYGKEQIQKFIMLSPKK
ncbi:translation initiation factor IF-3 [Sneathia sanguinegens]|uniref:translation initiation factor IF-3 n=1 Tax=Sneathia sanguinegens TaxID=40543 RepID=UPI000834F948|nr:translation initiation factor IF-3 [Sneathia sanguinegens]MDU4652922.1 translation initiation factor IF-3 [Sneathia sanguinegens]MDU7496666.1 translation initiation factor IF-3 [Sneathia sanguinegens]